MNYLEMTRIIIAHRPETIKQADRVVVMHQGEVYAPAKIQRLGKHNVKQFKLRKIQCKM